jgi:hypothetical protein
MNEYLLNNEVTIITNATRDLLLEKNPDSLILYNFYIKGCNYQETDSVWHLDIYVKKGLNWGTKRLALAKKVLLDYDLIETFKARNSNGTFGKTYIRVKYLFKKETKETLINQQVIHNTPKPRVGETTSELQTTNALSNYNINALSNLNTNAYTQEKSEKKQKDIKNKAVHKEILDCYNFHFKKNARPSKDLSWTKNADEWLKIYSLEEIKLAIENWYKYPHWSKNDGEIPPLSLMFRTRNKNGEANYIDQLLALGETKVANDENEYFPSDWWEKAIK